MNKEYVLTKEQISKKQKIFNILKKEFDNSFKELCNCDMNNCDNEYLNNKYNIKEGNYKRIIKNK